MQRTPLVNAVEMSELSPGFQILPHDTRYYLLHSGDLAKVCAPFPSTEEITGERFGVEVIHAEPGQYTGTILNDLDHTLRHGYAKNQTIEFDYRHIYQIAHRSQLGDQ